MNFACLIKDPFIRLLAVIYRNQVKFYSTAIAASLQRCDNDALLPFSIHDTAAVACDNHRHTSLGMGGYIPRPQYFDGGGSMQSSHPMWMGDLF